MKTAIFLVSLTTVGAFTNIAFAETDCAKFAVSVRHAVEAKPDSVLEIVEKKVAAHGDCACEIVKAAIIASKADAEAVAAIVETAAGVAPEHMRLIAQCAVAVAPDALSEVQAVMIRLDPGQGESAASSAKSAKSPKAPIEVLPDSNPLDFPGDGPPPPFPPIPPIPPLDPEIPFEPEKPGTKTDIIIDDFDPQPVDQ